MVMRELAACSTVGRKHALHVLAMALAVAAPAQESLEDPANQAHWSFVAPRMVEAPAVAGRDVRTAIDAFVAARLEQSGLERSPEADRRTLIRRLTFDLTGLPPTRDEVAAFVADTRADAYERLVDDLLARPQYGERLALRWLDLARYADTNGYSIDGGRHMWAWRDWVIDAYNQNMPFDQFTVEQLAGDLIPNATESQRIASGFNRNHMNTHEGGTILEECRVAYVADRVSTTALTWMGLTVGCAQCHDHKYDPVSQREYYELFAFFNTITDKGNDGNSGVNSVPFVPVYGEQQKAELERMQGAIGKLEAKLLTPDAELDAAQAIWQQEQQELHHPVVEWRPWHLRRPDRAANANEAFATDYGPEVKLDLGERTAFGKPRWSVRKDLVDGRTHSLPVQRAAYYLHRTVVASRATSIELSLGSDDAIRAWWNGKLVLDKNVRRAVAPDQELLALDLPAGESELLIKIVNDGGPGGFYCKVKRSGLPIEVAAALRRTPSELSTSERDVLLRYYRGTAEELAPVRQALDTAREELAAIEAKPVTTVMVMEEQAKARETYLLVRGQYDLRGDKVSAGTPAFLPAMSDSAPRNRLGLAHWLVDPEHPLTARVAVNGLWQMLFGTGLVKTSEDFGTQGEAPSHPELLDWLAATFVKSGWDQKQLLRRIVTSATYRQSSRASKGATARDPDNRLLARGPSFRLPAEFIRDSALAVSGLLNRQVGGPSARPYQPDGLWREMSHFGSTPATEQVYKQDHGRKLYRRSLYTIWKRTVPPPTMLAFDAPSRELCTPRRGRTNTPLQALVLLNETGFVEAARALAQRVLQAGGEQSPSRIEFAFETCTGRVPTPAEQGVLRATLTRELRRFADDRNAAEKLLAIGESVRDERLDPVEHAAWTVVASVLLNLSEVVTKG